jgi:hypothetical protein
MTSKRVRNTTAGGKRKRDVQSESDGAASAQRVTKKRDKTSAKRREATPRVSDAEVRPNDAATKGNGVSDEESTEDDRPAMRTKPAKGKARYWGILTGRFFLTLSLQATKHPRGIW